MRFKDYVIERYQPTPWFEKGTTITLYHGTTWPLAQQIKKKGLKPLRVKELEDLILKHIGLDPAKVPAWVKSESGFRPVDRTFLSTRREHAEGYARGTSGYGGEAATGIAFRALIYKTYGSDRVLSASEHIKLKKQLGKTQPTIVTIDLPWTEAQTHQPLGKLIYKFQKSFGDNWKTEAQQADLEFFSDKPIPKKYIVRIDKISGGTLEY